MSLGPAIQNLLGAIAQQRNMGVWRDTGVVRSVKIQNSNAGPCPVCRAAAARIYPLGMTPEIPIIGCENLEEGCRCVAVAHSFADREAGGLFP